MCDEGGSAELQCQPCRKKYSRKAEAGAGVGARRSWSRCPAQAGVRGRPRKFCGGAAFLWRGNPGGGAGRSPRGPEYRPAEPEPPPPPPLWDSPLPCPFRSPELEGTGRGHSRCSGPGSPPVGLSKVSAADVPPEVAELPSRKIPHPFVRWRRFEICFREPPGLRRGRGFL